MPLDEKKFIEKILPTGKTPEEIGVENLDIINKKLKGLMPHFAKRGIHPKEYTVLGVDHVEDFEGIVKVASVGMIPPGEKRLERKRRHIVVGDALPRVVTPIVIKSGSQIYMLLCAQDRITLGGKISIEVYRGSVPENTAADQLGLSLVKRKLPNLPEEADLLEVRDLGYFWNNTGISGVSSPVQALFYVTKQTMTAEEVKHSIKLEHSLDPDPKTGPVLPATEPVLKSIEEVKSR
ncbi:MAG: hypothetical protein UU97_C0023G0010, partial [candidate division WWE3 bacterium GW2011_GWD1_42_14]